MENRLCRGGLMMFEEMIVIKGVIVCAIDIVRRTDGG